MGTTAHIGRGGERRYPGAAGKVDLRAALDQEAHHRQPPGLGRLGKRRRAVETLRVDRRAVIEKQRNDLGLTGRRGACKRFCAQAIARLD